jgi:hypothetical protein
LGCSFDEGVRQSHEVGRSNRDGIWSDYSCLCCRGGDVDRLDGRTLNVRGAEGTRTDAVPFITEISETCACGQQFIILAKLRTTTYRLSELQVPGWVVRLVTSSHVPA